MTGARTIPIQQSYDWAPTSAMNPKYHGLPVRANLLPLEAVDQDSLIRAVLRLLSDGEEDG